MEQAVVVVEVCLEAAVVPVVRPPTPGGQAAAVDPVWFLPVAR